MKGGCGNNMIEDMIDNWEDDMLDTVDSLQHDEETISQTLLFKK